MSSAVCRICKRWKDRLALRSIALSIIDFFLQWAKTDHATKHLLSSKCLSEAAWINICSLGSNYMRTMCCYWLPCRCHIPARKISIIEITLSGSLVKREKLRTGIFSTSNLAYSGTSRTSIKCPFLWNWGWDFRVFAH